MQHQKGFKNYLDAQAAYKTLEEFPPPLLGYMQSVIKNKREGGCYDTTGKQEELSLDFQHQHKIVCAGTGLHPNAGVSETGESWSLLASQAN